MASHSSVNVTTAATKIIPAAGNGSHQFNRDKSRRVVTIKPVAAISVGGPGVTVANGLDIAAGATVSFPCPDELYAIGAAATTAKVLITGAD